MPTTDKPNNDDGLTLLDQKRALEDEIWLLAIAENYARGRLKGVLSREEVIAKYYTQYPEMKAYVDDHVARKTCLYGIRELRKRRETNSAGSAGTAFFCAAKARQKPRNGVDGAFSGQTGDDRFYCWAPIAATPVGNSAGRPQPRIRSPTKRIERTGRQRQYNDQLTHLWNRAARQALDLVLGGSRGAPPFRARSRVKDDR